MEEATTVEAITEESTTADDAKIEVSLSLLVNRVKISTCNACERSASLYSRMKSYVQET